jgi:hypothetical protein
MTATATCRTCGAEFKASKTGRTVHCPAHRGRTAPAKAPETKTVICYCGKTVKVDGFGTPTGHTCPVCEG